MNQADAIQEIKAERVKQDGVWGKMPRNYQPWLWHIVLAEEVGEVARAILEKDMQQMKRELIQVAAVALAWLEDIGDNDKWDWEDYR